MTIGAGQSAIGTTAAATSVTTGNITTAVEGSSFLVFVMRNAGVTLDSVTDSMSNSYTLLDTQTNAAVTGTGTLHLVTNGVGGATHNATANFSGSTAATIFLVEIVGGQRIDLLDHVAGTSDSSTAFNLSGILVKHLSDLIVSFIGWDGDGIETLTASGLIGGLTIIQSELDGTTLWTAAVAVSNRTHSYGSKEVRWNSPGGVQSVLIAVSLRELLLPQGLTKLQLELLGSGYDDFPAEVRNVNRWF